MPQDTFRQYWLWQDKPIISYVDEPIAELEQDKYQKMLHELKPISNQVGYDVILCSNDEIISIDNLMDNESQKIVIFDDFICKKKNHW